MIRIVLLSSLIAIGFAAETAQSRTASHPTVCTYSA